MADRTVPNAATKAEEEADAQVKAAADTSATPEEAEAADRNSLDPAAAEAEKTFNELGARVKGEGRLP
jgi:hypothetical protein